MSPSPQLAPAGSSTYSSNTMSVGDGTWDTQRNTFLLPNLVGLNFATMRYNGMGNRFRDLPQYHSLIRGHGIVAAITFLFIIPSAILIARFYTRNPFWALRLHIWLQILTLLLSTVVFVLGWFAVGPERSLTNPHHGIGLAIYVLILVQFIGGWWIHGREKGKRRMYIPMKLMLHQWMGRTIALLGLAQIPLGLTLYGSPVALFVLYALAVFALLVIYFILTHIRHKRGRYDDDSSYSYGPGSAVEERRDRSRFGGLAKAGAAGVGLAALSSRFRNRSRDRGHPEVVGSRRHSGSYVEDEKYSQYGRDPGREGGWTNRLLKIGAVAGAAALAKNFFDRRRERDGDSDTGRYGPPLGGATELSEDSLARVEEGRPRPSRQHPLNQPPNQPLNQPLNHRRSTSSMSYDSYMSASGARRRGHGLRDTVAGLGALGLARNIFKKRRDRKERRRVEEVRQQEIDDERRARQNSQRYTGDGFPRRGVRRSSVTTSTDYSNSVDDRPRYDQGVPPPIPAGTIPAGIAGGAAAGATLVNQDRQHTTLGAQNPVLSGAAPIGPVPMPPIPPDRQGILHQDSGSEAYLSAGGRQHRRHTSRNAATAAGLAGGAAGLAAGEPSSSRRDHRQSASGGDGSMASPPVSVKVKMHSDGRHVTLRRLPEEEAAAEREARRRERHTRRRRGGSASSLGGTETGNERFRRVEAMERQQEEEMRRERERAAQSNVNNLSVPLAVPPPPPFPTSSSSPIGPPRPGTGGSVGSPGTYDGTGTEASADYANNRRRRRAERAQAKQAKGVAGPGGRSGQTVEFE